MPGQSARTLGLLLGVTVLSVCEAASSPPFLCGPAVCNLPTVDDQFCTQEAEPRCAFCTDVEHSCFTSNMLGNCSMHCLNQACGPLSNVTHGYHNASAVNRPGTVVKVTCHSGYHVDTYDLLKCLSYGQWSGALPSCEQTTCRVPTIVHGTIVEDISYTVSSGSTLSYTCDIGYSPASTEATCLSTGTWGSLVCVEQHLESCNCTDSYWVIIAICSLCVNVLLIGLIFIYYKMKGKNTKNKDEENMEQLNRQPNSIAPQQQPNSIAPQQQPNGIAPQQQPNGIAPQQQPNGTLPQQQPNSIAPQQQPNGTLPQQQPNGIAPQQQPNGTLPQQQPNGILPQQQPNGYPNGTKPKPPRHANGSKPLMRVSTEDVNDNSSDRKQDGKKQCLTYEPPECDEDLPNEDHDPPSDGEQRTNKNQPCQGQHIEIVLTTKTENNTTVIMPEGYYNKDVKSEIKPGNEKSFHPEHFHKSTEATNDADGDSKETYKKKSFTESDDSVPSNGNMCQPVDDNHVPKRLIGNQTVGENDGNTQELSDQDAEGGSARCQSKNVSEEMIYTLAHQDDRSVGGKVLVNKQIFHSDDLKGKRRPNDVLQPRDTSTDVTYALPKNTADKGDFGGERRGIPQDNETHVRNPHGELSLECEQSLQGS